MTEIIVIAVLAVIIGSAAGYVYKSKKNGHKCIGCPEGTCRGGGSSCGGCSGNCSGCSAK